MSHKNINGRAGCEKFVNPIDVHIIFVVWAGIVYADWIPFVEQDISDPISDNIYSLDQFSFH